MGAEFSDTYHLTVPSLNKTGLQSESLTGNVADEITFALESIVLAFVVIAFVDELYSSHKTRKRFSLILTR